MKARYDLFGFLTIGGMTAILLAMGVSIFLRSWPLSERLAMLGVWLIVSFLIMVGVEGNARGIARKEIKVPWKWALSSFLLAGLLFIMALLVGDG